MRITVLLDDDAPPVELTDELLLWKTDAEGELRVVAGRRALGGQSGERWLWVPLAAFGAGAWVGIRLNEWPDAVWFERWAAAQMRLDDWRPNDLM